MSLKVNAVFCLDCKTVIESKYQHDFVTCKCGNVSVDGGKAYSRRCFKSDRYIEILSLSELRRLKAQAQENDPS